ncbi:MAG: STAS domain-containing protein [Actinomycetota bacterium]
MDLSLSDYSAGDATVVVVAGEIDLDTAPALRAELLRLLHAGRARLILDFSAVSFLDSSGLGALIGARRRAQLTGTRVELAAPSDRVLEVLRLTALDRVFPVHASVADALAAPPDDPS